MTANPFRLALVVGLLLTACFSSASTYAILMGVCKYEKPVHSDGSPVLDDAGNPMKLDLKGPLSDVHSYQHLLREQFHVPAWNITTLMDDQAGEQGFTDAFVSVIKKLHTGDHLFFAFSGHGTTIPSKDASDPKHAIVLHDLSFIDNDLFHTISRGLEQKGIDCVFVFDSCFSGGMSRDVFSFKGKPAQFRSKFVRSKFLPQGKLIRADSVTVKGIAKGQFGVGDYAFLESSSEDQTSTEVTSKDPSIGSTGLFTYFFVAAAKYDPQASLEDLMEATRRLIAEAKFEQKPKAAFSPESRGAHPLLPRF